MTYCEVYEFERRYNQVNRIDYNAMWKDMVAEFKNTFVGTYNELELGLEDLNKKFEAEKAKMENDYYAKKNAIIKEFKYECFKDCMFCYPNPNIHEALEYIFKMAKRSNSSFIGIYDEMCEISDDVEQIIKILQK